MRNGLSSFLNPDSTSAIPIPLTRIRIPYQLSNDSQVTIRIYNLAGQLVKTLNLGSKPRGFYIGKDKAAYWNGRNEAGETVSSGVYFYQIQAGKFNAIKKMVIVK